MNALKKYCVFTDVLGTMDPINHYSNVAGKTRGLCGDFDSLPEALTFLHTLESSSPPHKGKSAVYELTIGGWVRCRY